VAELVQHERDRWRRLYYVVWSLVGVGILLTAAGWILGQVSSALVPFLLAIILIYLFRSPVAWLQRRGMKRGAAVGTCYLVMFVVLGGALAFIVPPLVEQVRQFIVAFPTYYDQASVIVLNLQSQFNALVVPAWMDDALANIQETIAEQSATWSAALAKQVFSVGGSAVSLLTNGIFALIVAFWILKDLPVIAEEAERLAGPSRRDEAKTVISKVSNTLGGYLRGQLIISAVTAIIVGVGLSIAQVPYSIVIGLLAGLFNIIPWIGPTVTAIVAGIAAATIDPWHIVFALVVCLAAQQLTDWFVQPRVMSEQVDLHPLLVIFSLLAGAALFGFMGLLLSIPVAAIAKALFVYYFEKYTNSQLATAKGALFRTRADSPSAGSPDVCASAERADESVTSERPDDASGGSEENNS